MRGASAMSTPTSRRRPTARRDHFFFDLTNVITTVESTMPATSILPPSSTVTLILLTVPFSSVVSVLPSSFHFAVATTRSVPRHTVITSTFLALNSQDMPPWLSLSLGTGPSFVRTASSTQYPCSLGPP